MVQLFKSELLDRVGFPLHGFTKRSEGVSRGEYSSLNLAWNAGDDPDCVAENMSRLKATLGTDAPLARVDQVHGSKVVDAADLSLDPERSWISPPTVEGDGIVCAAGGKVLAVQTADCAAVLLADPETRIVGAVHAGWRGAANGVIRQAVRVMTALGAQVRAIAVAIGPSICAECYEVGEEVARRFPESADPIKGRPGKFSLDLGSAVEVSLIGAGISSANIDRIDACTSCLDGELFSHRRCGDSCGRTLGLISG